MQQFLIRQIQELIMDKGLLVVMGRNSHKVMQVGATPQWAGGAGQEDPPNVGAPRKGQVGKSRQEICPRA